MIGAARAAIRIAAQVSVFTTLVASEGLAIDRVVSVYPADGRAGLAKEFDVPAGRTVMGLQFYSNDAGTNFPQIALIGGDTSTPSDILATATVVGVDAEGVLTANWSAPVVADGHRMHVVVRFPASSARRQPGHGAGIGATDVSQVAGSYLVGDSEQAPVPILADLDMRLVFAAGKAAQATSTPLSQEERVLVTSDDSRTRFRFHLIEPTRTRLSIYDVRGRMVRRLADEVLGAGLRSYTWDGTDDSGDHAPRGIYLVQLDGGHVLRSTKFAYFR